MFFSHEWNHEIVPNNVTFITWDTTISLKILRLVSFEPREKQKYCSAMLHITFWCYYMLLNAWNAWCSLISVATMQMYFLCPQRLTFVLQSINEIWMWIWWWWWLSIVYYIEILVFKYWSWTWKYQSNMMKMVMIVSF